MPHAGTVLCRQPTSASRCSRGSAPARHEGYDRVVFEFRHALPGYDVRYDQGRSARTARASPAVDGDHVVQVRMENALDADLSEPSAPRTYTGPQRFWPGTPEVAELARVGGFEGV